MSRGEYTYGTLEESGGPFHVPQDRSQFNSLLQETGNNIFKINSNVSTLDKSLKQIGTPSDSDALRNRIQDVVKEMARSVQLNKNNLTMLTDKAKGLGKQEKLRVDKLRNEYLETMQRYSMVQKKLTTAFSTYPQIPKPKTSFTDDVDEEVSRTCYTDEPQAQRQMQGQAQANYDLELMKEREDQIRNIESAMVDVNEIYRDLGAMVTEQGDMIDSIEANVETTEDNVESANQQLLRARDYQKKARRKQCCIIMIIVIGLLILALILYLILK